MSKKTVLRFTTKELNTLVNNKLAHVKLITSRRKVSLHPNCLTDVETSVHEVLDASLAKFDHELKGILLSYKNIKVLKNLAKVLHDDPYLYVTIRADFYVFVPEVGCTLFGKVNKKSPDHLGCLVHKVFNVALPRPESDTGEEWQGFYVEPGQMVTFIVEYVDLTGSLPYMRGRLLDDGNYPKFEKNSNNGHPEETNDGGDNEEGNLSTSQDIKDLMDSAVSCFLVKKPKKKKLKKEEINFDSCDLPQPVCVNWSSSPSFSLYEGEKKVKSKKKSKCSNKTLSNEFELYDDDVSQENLISSKVKEKVSKKRKQNEYECQLSDFENIYKTVPNLIDPENSSNNKIRKQKRKYIKQEPAVINDVIVRNSEMEEGLEREGQNIAPPDILESPENLVPKKKKKKKKVDIVLEADESILTVESLAQSSVKEGVSIKQSKKLNSILSDEVATSTPKEHKEYQNFLSNLSEIKRGFSADDMGTPKVLKLSKKQKIKKMDINEKDFRNLTDTNIDDYCNKIGKDVQNYDVEMKAKHTNKDKTKKGKESNGSLSSSSGSSEKHRLIKSKEKKKSVSMSEACNVLLENMLSKLGTSMQDPNCDTKKKEPDTARNIKSSKKRNLSLGNMSAEIVKTIEREENSSNDFSSHSSENEMDNECSGTKNVSKINVCEGSAEKLKKHKSKTEIMNTENSPITKFNERSTRKTTKNKHNTLDLSVENSIEAKLPSSQSEKSPTKKNKNQVCSEEGFGESEEANKVKQTKKNDITFWGFPDSLMEIQKNILEKLKSEMSPSKDKKLMSEMSPSKDKKLMSEMSPTKDKKKKSEMSPTKDKKKKLEITPKKNKKLSFEMSPTMDKKLRSEMSPTMDKILRSEMSPTVDKKLTSEMSPTMDKKLTSEMSPTTDKRLRSEMSPTMDKILWSEMSPTMDKKLRSEMSPTMDKKLRSEMSPTMDKILRSEMSPAKDKKKKSEKSPTKDKKKKSEMSPTRNKKLKKRQLEDGICDNINEKSSGRKVAKLDGANYKQSEDVTDFKVSKRKTKIADKQKSKEANEIVTQITDSPVKGQDVKNKIVNSSNTGARGEKVGTSLEQEKDALLHKMLSSIAGVIDLEKDNMRIRKERKKERKKSKQIIEVQENQTSDVPLENLFFQQKYGDRNSIINQDEKCEVTGKKQETKKKKKGNGKLLFCEGDGNGRAKDDGKDAETIGVGNTIFENTKKNKLKIGEEMNQIQNQLNIGELDTNISNVENLKKASQIASAEHRQKKGKKGKTNRNNDDKIGLAETKEPDHRKKEKRHSAISQEEEESPASLAERLLQEFIQQKKGKI